MRFAASSEAISTIESAECLFYAVIVNCSSWCNRATAQCRKRFIYCRGNIQLYEAFSYFKLNPPEEKLCSGDSRHLHQEDFFEYLCYPICFTDLTSITQTLFYITHYRDTQASWINYFGLIIMLKPTIAILCLSVVLLSSTVKGVSLTQVIDSLKDDAVRRCSSPSCDSAFIKTTFNYFLFACATGGCDDDKVLRVTPFGSSSYIHQYCVLKEGFHSPNWSVRVQADLVSTGARIVLVAVPATSRLEQEYFKRPYVLSTVIPRTQLYLVNRFVRKFCGDTNY